MRSVHTVTTVSHAVPVPLQQDSVLKLKLTPVTRCGGLAARRV